MSDTQACYAGNPHEYDEIKCSVCGATKAIGIAEHLLDEGMETSFQAMTDEQQIAWDRKMGAHHIDAYVSAAGIPLFNLSGRYSLEELERIVRIAKEKARE